MTLEDELSRGLDDLARGAGSADGLGSNIRRAATRRRTHLMQARAAMAVASVGAVIIAIVAWRGSAGNDVETVPIAPDTTVSTTAPPTSTPTSTVVSATTPPSSVPTTAASTTFAGAIDDGSIAEFDLATGAQTRVIESPLPGDSAHAELVTVVHGQVYVLRTFGTCYSTVEKLGDKRNPLIDSGLDDEVSAFAVSPDGLSTAWVITNCSSREATLILQMAGAPTVKEIKIGTAPPSVNDLSLANDGRVALGLSASAANAQTVGILSATATSFGDAEIVPVADGCEAARPRFLENGSLTVISCRDSDPSNLAGFGQVDTNAPLTKIFDLPGRCDGHITDHIIALDWNDAGTDAIVEESTGLVYRWNAGAGIVDIPTHASPVGF